MGWRRSASRIPRPSRPQRRRWSSGRRGGSILDPALTDLSREVPGLESARFPIAPGSPFDGRTLGDTRARTLTGCSIVALVRDADVVPSPGPEDGLRAGDVLVAIGSASGLEQLDRRLSGQADS